MQPFLAYSTFVAPPVDHDYDSMCETLFDSDKQLYSINVKWSTSTVDCGFAVAIDHFSVLLYNESQTDSDNTSSSHELLHVGELEVPFDMVVKFMQCVHKFGIHVHVMKKLTV